MIVKQNDNIRKLINQDSCLIATSIGGAPLHKGHINLIEECKHSVARLLWNLSQISYISHYNNIKLLVIVNSDNFLIRKHGFSFQDENERALLINCLKPVDFVTVWHSDTQYIDEALLHFKPSFLCKGGDRSGPEFMPGCELDAAASIGCEILYGVGGSTKVNSSSDLMKRCANHYLFNKPANEWVDNMELFTQGQFPKL